MAMDLIVHEGIIGKKSKFGKTIKDRLSCRASTAEKWFMFAQAKSAYDNLSTLTGCFLMCADVFANGILIKLVLKTIDKP